MHNGEPPASVTLETVLTRENLKAAWMAVKANHGAAGVDGRGVERTAEHLRAHWETIAAKLRAGAYSPAAVRAVDIPKAHGGTRTLGIPNVQDRLIQQAIHQALSPRWEARQSLTSEQLRDQWREYIVGWWNYFRIATWRREVEKLSGWIRRHIRKCFWIRWKTPRGRINALRRLGVKGRALGLGYTGLGAWAVARLWALNQALSNATLRRYGFIIPWDSAEANG